MGPSPEFTRRSGACGRLEQQFWTKLNPRFADNSAREHRNPAGRNRDSTPNSWANYAGIDLTERFDSRKHHAAINEPEPHEYSWQFAERPPLRNFAGHGKWSVRLHADDRVVKFEAVDPWQPGQQQQQHVTGNESHARRALPSRC